MRRRVRRKTRRFELPKISLTPLIDTAFTLLIIFMVAAPMMNHGIKVDLPQGATKEAPQQQELVVTITKEDHLFFNSFPVWKEQQMAPYL